ncbi:efflux RND transporter periplasmic adaptor subunit [Spirochaetia bacterium 38H-sp]|uniref:Efflux RND transporter periplasmic adaptor subunit n=1 Tax=Rarispira pelagica TaxID=3141764 RepID=A0ABU9UC98_9SPIR
MAANKKKIGVFIVLGLIAIVFIVSLVNRRGGDSYKEVSALKVVSHYVRDEVSARGDVKAVQEMQVVSQVSGIVSEVLVEDGQRVVRGQVLFRLDTTDIGGQLYQAESALASARLAVRRELINLRIAYQEAKNVLESAEKEYARVSELHEIGSASDEELRRAKDALESARQQLSSAKQQLNLREGLPPDANRPEELSEIDYIVENSPEVKQAKANLESARQNIGRYVISASIPGIVGTVAATRGMVVAPGTPLAYIYDDSVLEILSYVDEVDVPGVKKGSPVRIESDLALDKELFGWVSWISPIIEASASGKTARVKIRLSDDSKGYVRIGASCSVFIGGDERLSPVIPLDAYFIENSKQYVWILVPYESSAKQGGASDMGNKASVESENDSFYNGNGFEIGKSINTDGLYVTKKQEIETGTLGPGYIEVTSGLKEGDYILASSDMLITEGMQVKIADVSDSVKPSEEGENE